MGEREPIHTEAINGLMQEKRERELEGESRLRFWLEGEPGQDGLAVLGTTQRVDIRLKAHQEIPPDPPKDTLWERIRGKNFIWGRK